MAAAALLERLLLCNPRPSADRGALLHIMLVVEGASERGKLCMHARRVLEGETERARRGVGMRQGVTYLRDHP